MTEEEQKRMKNLFNSARLADDADIMRVVSALVELKLELEDAKETAATDYGRIEALTQRVFDCEAQLQKMQVKKLKEMSRRYS